MSTRKLPRHVDPDRHLGLLSADVDPFITEQARRKLGASGLRIRSAALLITERSNTGSDVMRHAAKTERAELESLIDKLDNFDVEIAQAEADKKHCGDDALSAAIDLKIAQLKVEQLTPDCFERDPSKTLLLLHHNTNLRSFPALEKLRNTPTAQRLAEPDMFDDLIQTCKVEVSSLTNSILEARHSQLNGYYNAITALSSCGSIEED